MYRSLHRIIGLSDLASYLVKFKDEAIMGLVNVEYFCSMLRQIADDIEKASDKYHS